MKAFKQYEEAISIIANFTESSRFGFLKVSTFDFTWSQNVQENYIINVQTRQDGGGGGGGVGESYTHKRAPLRGYGARGRNKTTQLRER